MDKRGGLNLILQYIVLEIKGRNEMNVSARGVCLGQAKKEGNEIIIKKRERI